jgi:hypothetical protein
MRITSFRPRRRRIPLARLLGSALALGACSPTEPDAPAIPLPYRAQPGEARVAIGDSVRFTWTDDRGRIVTFPSLRSDTPTVATVRESGWVVGLAAGTALIRPDGVLPLVFARVTVVPRN